ncbi:MAG: matrixin family metalloprotease, partial [Candidatus Marinimicrobia bacterium]|nr:matrixin family metalloprotease [Candidatus Neomarinimicrobiota bacterium]
MRAWLIYGPFDLSDASSAALDFYYWNNSESGWDYFKYMASTDGATFYGYQHSGSTGGWVQRSFDLSNVPSFGDMTGYSQVYIAFLFTSDGSITNEGAYVDDIVLTKTVVTLPDLAVQSVSVINRQASYSPGDQVDVSNSTTNIGGSTSASYRVDFYASTNTTITTGDYYMGGYDRSGLGAGQTHNYTSYPVLPSSLPAGSYYIGLIVTSSNDGNSSNNTGYDGTPISVVVGPDLITTTITIQGNDATEGDAFWFRPRVQNVGDATAGSSHARFYLSLDNDFDVSDDYEVLPKKSVSSLTPTSYSDIQWDISSFPDLSSGDYNVWMVIVVDSDGEVTESDENNTFKSSGSIVVHDPVPYPQIEVSPLTLDVYEPIGALSLVQRIDDPLAINLKNRQFIPEPSSSLSPDRMQRGNDSRAHIIIQFHDQLDASKINDLQAAGIEVLQYVSSRSVAAAVPANFTASNYQMIRWVGQLENHDKISQRARQTLSADSDYVLVEAFPDVTGESLKIILSDLGIENLDRSSLPEYVALIYASLAVIEELARQDEISWIMAASRPLIEGDHVYYCPGAMTPYGPIANYVTYGPGWDGPGLGSVSLSYHFVNGTADIAGDQERVEILRGLTRWADHVQISFAEAALPNQNQSLDILFATGDHGDGYPFDGTGSVLAHCFFPAPDPNPETIAGDCHFDDDETWQIGSDIDMFSVALHEFGHGLGLAHSDDPSAVMYAYYQMVTDLQPDDIAGIKALYAAREDQFTISNTGDETLLVSDISSNKVWLSESPAVPPTLTLATSESQVITVNVDWAAVAYPSDQASVAITSNDPDENLVTVTITAHPQAQSPLVADIPDQTTEEGGSFATIALDDYVSDTDNSYSEITWTYS